MLRCHCQASVFFCNCPDISHNRVSQLLQPLFLQYLLISDCRSRGIILPIGYSNGVGKPRKCHCKQFSLFLMILFSMRKSILGLAKNCHCNRIVNISGVIVSERACISVSCLGGYFGYPKVSLSFSESDECVLLLTISSHYSGLSKATCLLYSYAPDFYLATF